ncbi:phenylalanine--tRNA ligase subunit alpha [Candidatus Uhrbacteria bacterium]|nr:phenylalanine--tRNA ligase subunit alpha [Candidatus Uhrbacteria bacterium]
MHHALQKLHEETLQKIVEVNDLEGVEVLELAVLGRKQGALTALLRQLGALAPEERKRAGQRANEVKQDIERALDERRTALRAQRMAGLEEAEWMDVTLPGTPFPRGAVHPVSVAIQEIATIFARIGFLRARHPEVDSDYYAFEALHMPPGHPARDEWETFFVASAADGDQNGKQRERIVLTPHTSNGQVREMEKGYLPIRMINIGKCYRRQIDVSHVPVFHQFEGLLVDRQVTVAHLKGTLEYFVRSYFGPDRTIRLRPYHFQFTEPSFEIDISCAVCGGSGVQGGARCRLCKSGWLELGGAGMVHPKVLQAGRIDPRTHAGFAFGWGVERVLMMRHGISDIRLLYCNDLRVGGAAV